MEGVSWRRGAILLLRSYIEVSRLIVRTDHQSLRWILDFKILVDREAHWRLFFTELDFEKNHCPTRKNMATDALYGLQSEAVDHINLHDDLPHQHDKRIGSMSRHAEETNNTLLSLKRTFPDKLREQRADSLRCELSKLSKVLVGQYCLHEYGILKTRS